MRGLGSTAWGSSTRSRSIYAGSQRGFSCGGVDWVLEFPEIPRAAVATPDIAHDPTSSVATGPARRPSSKADPALASKTSASIPAARTWPTGAHLNRFSSRQRMPGMDAEFFRTRVAAAHGRAAAGSGLLHERTGKARGRRLSPPLGLRREVPATAMPTRIRAPLVAAAAPSQVAVEPDAPQRPLRAGGGAVADLVLAALHSPQRPIGTAERGRETLGFASRAKRGSASWQRRAPPPPVPGTPTEESGPVPRCARRSSAWS